MSPIPDLIREPLERAIRAFANREDIIRKPDFIKLDEATRARSWTVARIKRLEVLNDLYGEMMRTIADGGGYRDWIDSMNETMDRRGWTGLEPWHQHLVFEQNVNMAYTAGRYDQMRSAGIKRWRKLPSTSVNPRPDHAALDGRIFTADVSPPPWDFGCQCEWEPVFEDEDNTRRGRTTNPAVTSEQEFQFHAKSFFSKIDVDMRKYPPQWREKIRGIFADEKARANLE
jgi:uncharacterized protein with gpF-like domain